MKITKKVLFVIGGALAGAWLLGTVFGCAVAAGWGIISLLGLGIGAYAGLLVFEWRERAGS